MALRNHSERFPAQATALLFGMFVTCASAITPLTPRLTPETRAELLADLCRSKLPKVAQNSVVLAITGALGLQAASGPIRYSSDYAHLPDVDGRVTRVSDGCSRVGAQARLQTEAEVLAISIDATYCLVGPAEWSSSQQVVSRVHP